MENILPVNIEFGGMGGSSSQNSCASVFSSSRPHAESLAIFLPSTECEKSSMTCEVLFFLSFNMLCARIAGVPNNNGSMR